MRKKLITKTYLKDVKKYKQTINYDMDDCYISIKKIIDIAKPFFSHANTCLIDKGYFIVEVLPNCENYAMRIFFNEKKERLLYYFDISLKNGLDNETNIPYYDDLYLDVVLSNGKVDVLDEDELQDAFDKGAISESEFILANKTKDNLIKSINYNKNKYINMNIEEYLE